VFQKIVRTNSKWFHYQGSVIFQGSVGCIEERYLSDSVLDAFWKERRYVAVCETIFQEPRRNLTGEDDFGNEFSLSMMMTRKIKLTPLSSHDIIYHS
jgi:hypothetical protein